MNYWILYDAFLAWEQAEKERESGEVEAVPLLSIEEKGRTAAKRSSTYISTKHCCLYGLLPLLKAPTKNLNQSMFKRFFSRVPVK